LSAAADKAKEDHPTKPPRPTSCNQPFPRET
jgi:hypothetical protein